MILQFIVVGYIFLTYRYVILKGDDKKWKNVKNVDKLVVALLLGLLLSLAAESLNPFFTSNSNWDEGMMKLSEYFLIIIISYILVNWPIGSKTIFEEIKFYILKSVDILFFSIAIMGLSRTISGKYDILNGIGVTITIIICTPFVFGKITTFLEKIRNRNTGN